MTISARNITIDLDRLRGVRESAGYSIRDISRALNVNASTIYRYEKGLTKIPANNYLTMCEIYKIDPREIADG